MSDDALQALFLHETKLVRSLYYQIMMHPEPARPEVVIGLSRGGLVPAIALSHALGVPLVPLRYSTRDHEATDLQTLVHAAIEFHHKRVLVVDDICDTGLTFQKLSELLDVTLFGPRSWATLYERSTSAFKSDFVGEYVHDEHWVDFSWEVQMMTTYPAPK